jgi:hypothetical protein
MSFKAETLPKAHDEKNARRGKGLLHLPCGATKIDGYNS